MEIVEVGPRDGLQNERTRLSTTEKVEFITRLGLAGAQRIEAVSFVNPRKVPQMADAEAVMNGVRRDRGIRYSGLVANRRGIDRAAAAGMDEVNVVIVATDTLSRRNQGVDTGQMLASWAELCGAARDQGLRVTATVGAAFGCPFEGEVAVQRIFDIARRLSDAPPDELALADTIGVGVPTQVVELVGCVKSIFGALPLRCHFHNTRNTGYANAVAAIQAGVEVLDASVGGIGGCPFAPNATGNVATEDLAYLLDRMRIPTGLELTELFRTSAWVGERLRTPIPALLGRAGGFPHEGVQAR